MFSKKLLVTVAMCSTLVFSLMACSNNNTPNSNMSNINYTITQEAGDSANLKMANTPISFFWFPNQLLEWNPSEDKDIEYNKSVVPLAKRVDKNQLKTINDTQNKDFNVVALSIMNSSTSGNPSQGSNKFGSNTFSYWQYIDKLVYWGGSSGEGIIVPPSPDVVDSAHKNGVPVLGTVFFPTTTHGGKAEWVDQFLQKDENGKFPMIDKLIEVCEVLGFDGWFINQETGLTVRENDFIDQSETVKEGAKITKKHAELMQEFIREFKKKSDLEIMWYDSITKDGQMDWQNGLTEKNQYFLIDENNQKVADTMFLNFWWTSKKLADQQLLKTSKEKANELGLNTYDLYAGIDIQENGTNTNIRWDLFEDENGVPYTSLGLYCPSWTFFSSSNIDEFQSKENRLWVNELGDPSKKGDMADDNFRGISTYAVEKTVVNSLPFNTSFNMGNGYNFFINGQKVSLLDWNNRSLADVMPTYRWIINNEGENTLKASIDYANAFHGGNSIKLNGNLKAGKGSTIKLFSSDLTLEEGVKFKTSLMSSSDIVVSLILELEDGTSEEIKGSQKVSSDWTTIEFDVSKLTGKKVKSISYKVMSENDASNININFGNIRIGTEKVKNVDASNLKVDEVVFEEDDIYAGVRLSFDVSNKEDASHYEIYKINEDKSKTFLGATITNRYFVNALLRDEKSNSTVFEVVPVNKDMSRGKSSTTKMEWPDNSIPKANFKASKTLVAPGEEVTFESLSSKVTENVEWVFEGANVEKSTDLSPKVTYANEGTYSVTLKAKNASGEDVKVMEKYITVLNDAKDNYKNLSLGKSSEASSFVNAKEAPEFAVDGKLDTKWCAVGTPPHNIVIDLGSSSLISEVKIAHAEAGNESPDMNTSDYTIEVSEDGVNFTEVVSVKKNSKANTVDTFKAVNARYVRINVIKPTQGSDSATRIYEIEINGISK